MAAGWIAIRLGFSTCAADLAAEDDMEVTCMSLLGKAAGDKFPRVGPQPRRHPRKRCPPQPRFQPPTFLRTTGRANSLARPVLFAPLPPLDPISTTASCPTNLATPNVV